MIKCRELHADGDNQVNKFDEYMITDDFTLLLSIIESNLHDSNVEVWCTEPSAGISGF